MHRAGYAALGLDYAYVPFKVEDLEGALRGMRALGIRGLGVSMPFKVAILPLLDRLDPLAEKIGAVNTVVNEGGVLSGFNTDAVGGVRALSEGLPLAAGRRVCVVGAGGAARALVVGLAAEKMQVHVVNRTAERARELAESVTRRLGVEVTGGGLSELRDLAGFDALVNASSAGMAEYGSQSPIPPDALRPGLVVLDIVYKPIETALVRAGRARGCVVVHGGRMLLHQACRQFELYTGLAAPIDAMSVALQETG